MSATMSASLNNPALNRPKIIAGVCGDIARRAAVPTWMPRLAFLIFFALHWLLAAILYCVLAKTLCAGKSTATPKLNPWPTNPWPTSPWPTNQGNSPPPYTPPTQTYADVQSRFAKLDERLGHLEAATLHSEAELRRAFRDLERNP